MLLHGMRVFRSTGILRCSRTVMYSEGSVAFHESELRERMAQAEIRVCTETVVLKGQFSVRCCLSGKKVVV